MYHRRTSKSASIGIVMFHVEKIAGLTVPNIWVCAFVKK